MGSSSAGSSGSPRSTSARPISSAKKRLPPAARRTRSSVRRESATPRSRAQQELELAGVQAPEREALEARVRERAVELERRLRATAAPDAEEADPLVLQAPRDERQRALGRVVEPLGVVDREQRRRLLAASARSTPEQPQSDGALERLLPSGLRAQQRHLQRAPLRRGQVGHGCLGHLGEQIAERGVGQLRLALARPAAQDALPVSGGRRRAPGSRASSCRCRPRPPATAPTGPEAIAPRNSSTRPSSASRPMSVRVCAAFANAPPTGRAHRTPARRQVEVRPSRGRSVGRARARARRAHPSRWPNAPERGATHPNAVRAHVRLLDLPAHGQVHLGRERRVSVRKPAGHGRHVLPGRRADLRHAGRAEAPARRAVLQRDARVARQRALRLASDDVGDAPARGRVVTQHLRHSADPRHGLRAHREQRDVRLGKAIGMGGAEHDRAGQERRDGACWPRPRLSHRLIQSAREDAVCAIGGVGWSIR